MEEKQERKRPTCHFCGQPLSREDAQITDGRCCFDCALTYLAGEPEPAKLWRYETTQASG